MVPFLRKHARCCLQRRAGKSSLRALKAMANWIRHEVKDDECSNVSVLPAQDPVWYLGRKSRVDIFRQSLSHDCENCPPDNSCVSAPPVDIYSSRSLAGDLRHEMQINICGYFCKRAQPVYRCGRVTKLVLGNLISGLFGVLMRRQKLIHNAELR